MDVGTSFAKYFIFIINFMFAAIGIAIAGLGIFILVKLDDVFEIGGTILSAIQITLIALGSVILIISFLGCCGAITENKCMLLSFSLILITICVAEIALVIVANANRDEVENTLGKELNRTLVESNDEPKFRTAWDLLQTNLECCGVEGPRDWLVHNDTYVPDSCCQNAVKCYVNNAHTTGCKKAVMNYFFDNSMMLYYIIVGIGVLQLISILMSCCLFSVFRQQ